MTLFEEILADRVHGASEVEARLLRTLLQAGPPGPDDLRELTRAVLRHQPSMANLLTLLNDLWLAQDRGEPWEGTIRGRLDRSLEKLDRSFLASLGESLGGLDRSRPVTLITLSRSGTVLRALIAAHQEGVGLRVVVGEGRPGGEGKDTARDLAGAGIDTWVAADAALPALLHEPDTLTLPFKVEIGRTAVVVGTDAVSDAFFLNKIGTYGLALAAKRAGVPLLLLTNESKLLPPALARSVAVQTGDPAELGAPGKALNFYFERVPLNLVSLAILGAGTLRPGELRERAAALPVSPGLLEELAVESPAG
ncbi:MAG TPA: hypothetical protein VMW27_01630 [Thermoanaerobaculia bacterium]|nr:hypothetical protein [Thermoanaerobaculia bacterium]